MLIDTTLLIDFLRGKKEAVDFLKKQQMLQLYTTEINVFELVVGTYLKKGQNPQKEIEKISALLSQFIVLPLERRGTIKAGEIAASLIKRGQKIEETDALIAGIALSNGIMEIVTANSFHYEKIPEIKVIGY